MQHTVVVGGGGGGETKFYCITGIGLGQGSVIVIKKNILNKSGKCRVGLQDGLWQWMGKIQVFLTKKLFHRFYEKN